ncbi:MAG: phenylalanine--tRNA ligase subunit alpha [Christensenellaceae bacterium]|jgi:phenylalanyl-tRNA synthetase alpha chain|nr:phenylalanine--tRNA ligase subunit alpha [Christensenellaceae bacterium]
MEKELKALKTLADCQAFHAKYLGKSGEITKQLQGLKDIEPSKRATRGAELNILRRETEEKLFKIQHDIEAAEANAKLMNDPLIDVTNPLTYTARPSGPGVTPGGLHPITQVIREVEEIFAGMGFIIEDGPEIATEYECFDALNCPQEHPARDMQDTFWLSDGRCLRTQTSAWQNHMMKKYGPEFRAICPGRVFRNEALDARHENTFFQCEGMMIGKDISIANLIYFMKAALTAVFKKDINIRLRPGYFPFVEPGFELDASCVFCKSGEHCPVCKSSGWVEFCGCGMIHPNVLREGGIDPTKYQGFAFGFGITRLAMLKYDLNDCRWFNSGNLEFLQGGTK